MAFWERVKEDLKKAAKESWEVAKGGAKIAAAKSKEVAQVEKLRLKAVTTRKKAEKLFYELGGAVYELAKPPYGNPLQNAKVTKIIEEIRKLEDEIGKVEAEIKKTKEEYKEKKKAII
ncbi:MAG: hypothetical protein HY883_01960 [Deltaproteobacteria bacterium]|nr:hypothetical protein [Deltaproteobacteria bacterium]